MKPQPTNQPGHTKRHVRNPNDRRYLRSQTRIRRVILKALRHRRLSMQVQELCNDAGVSTPTFYFHHSSAEVALEIFEGELMRDLEGRLLHDHIGREMAFVILLNFIVDKRAYFRATLLKHNTWLFARIFARLRPILVSGNISDKCYDIYTGNLIAIIYCWAKYENFSKDKISLYTKKLSQVRIMDLGL